MHRVPATIDLLDLTLNLLDEAPLWGSVWVNEDWQYRVLNCNNPFSHDCCQLLIRAEFTTCAGTSICGAVNYDSVDNEVVLVLLFCGNRRLIYNRWFHPDRAESEVQELIQRREQIFPLHFQTTILDQSGHPYQGVFKPR